MAKLQGNKISHYISYLVVRGGIQLFSLLSMKNLHRLSNFLCWFFNRGIGYRKKIIIQNLKITFPDKPSGWINTIKNKFYLNFTDLLLESVKGFTLPKETLTKRYQFPNADIFDPYFKRKESVLLIGSHYANWEWGVLSVAQWLKHKVIGVYKPIKNPLIDQYINNARQQWGLHLTSMNQTGRAMVLNRNEPCAYVFIADQSPSDVHNAHWIPFFGKETAFLHGVDRIARRTGYPVFIFNINRKKRGYYEVVFELLCSNPKDLPPQEITKRFAHALEAQIRKKPEDWLWSHRRWKRTRPASTMTSSD